MLIDLIARLPDGSSTVRYEGRRYRVQVDRPIGGKIHKVLAQELGGNDLISANVYLTAAGEQFRPCEMPAAKVLAFLHGWEPDGIFDADDDVDTDR